MRQVNSRHALAMAIQAGIRGVGCQRFERGMEQTGRGRASSNHREKDNRPLDVIVNDRVGGKVELIRSAIFFIPDI